MPPADVTGKTAHGDIALLTYEALNPAAIEATVRSAEAGAVVSFVGYTRDNFQGKRVTHLEYESYTPLALKTLQAILLEARSLPALPPSLNACCGPAHHHVHVENGSAKVDVTQMTIVHLLGNSPPLTPSLVICVATPHRREAFYLCGWLLERVKESAQIWKREWYDDGSRLTGKDGHGPNSKDSQTTQEGVWKENFPADVE